VLTAAGLLLYSVAVLSVGPRLLPKFTRRGDAPRLGVAVWLTAIATVLVAWVGAVVFFIIEVARHWKHPELVVLSCLYQLHGLFIGDHSGAPQALALAIVAGVSGAVGVTCVRLSRALTRLRTRAYGHAEAARLVGRSTGDPDVVVIDAPNPAAYCVAGRPPAIVVTSATLAVLGNEELSAVLAHERAHLAGGHLNVVAVLRSLASVFPNLALMTGGAAEVARLLEMCADDAAVRCHGNAALLSGLMSLVGAAPAEALAAADVAVLARAERLTATPTRRSRIGVQAALAAAMTIMLSVPLIGPVLALLGLPTCGP
jgi:Zn-dependent protease with chaperone function